MSGDIVALETSHVRVCRKDNYMAQMCPLSCRKPGAGGGTSAQQSRRRSGPSEQYNHYSVVKLWILYVVNWLFSTFQPNGPTRGGQQLARSNDKPVWRLVINKATVQPLRFRPPFIPLMLLFLISNVGGTLARTYADIEHYGSERYEAHRAGGLMSNEYNLMEMPQEQLDAYEEYMASQQTLMAQVDVGTGAGPFGPGPTPPKPNLPPHEIQALKDLYMATDGEHWRWFNASFSISTVKWDFSNDPHPCNPLWQGILCTLVPSGGYYHVIALDLQMHLLTGTLPASFFNLTQLHGFSLATNNLYGTIPSAISNLKLTQVVDFANNEFTGQFPKEMAECSNLRLFYAYNNHLNGTIPPEMGTLSHLRVMKFTLNEMTGPLPPSIGNLIHLELLYLGRNQFTGTVPESYGNLSNCTTLLIYKNQLTGTLPASLAGLSNITSIDFDDNHFSGTIPDFIGNLSTLLLLYLNNNDFTGTIPDSLARLPRLQNLYLHDNLLSGSIPESLGYMPSLMSLELSHNGLHYTIPESIFSLPSLSVLLLSFNHLTGTVPPELGTMYTLQTLEIAHNHFTGTIPASLGQLKNLTNLYLYENNLHGTVPPELGDLPIMIYLYLYSNHLSGTLPRTLSRIPELSSFFFQKNMLSGSLDGVFNATNQQFLSLIQLSHNQLTGTLPDEIFRLPELSTLVLVGNCFTGTIPDSVCDCETLCTLSLDGIRSASSCQNVMLPGISTSYVLTSKVPGGVPPCLFALPSLSTLHLSGNGLTGTLPDNLTISEKLIDLALSHNKLTGTIPRVIQDRQWYNLDLSYNKFHGVLSTSISTIQRNFTFEHTFNRLPNRNITLNLPVPTSALSLRNNRLSDRIPDTIRNMLNISVLYGNLFECNFDESDLPPNDDGKHTYQCGSSSFDISYYLWLACVMATFLVAFSIYYWRHYLEPWIGGVFTSIVYIKRWLNIVTWYDQENFRSKSRLHHYQYVMKVCENMCRAAFWCTVFILCAMLPMYAAASMYYGTHTYEYAWTASAAFLSGYPALALLMVFFMILLALLLVIFRFSFRELRRFLHELPEDFHFSVMEDFAEEAAVEEQTDNKYSSWYEKAAIYLAFILINFVIVGGVNVAYVYVVIYADSKYFTAAQIALSVFKLGWNSLGSVLLIRWTHHQIASSATKDWKFKGAGFFAIQLFVALFNFIAIPCLVVGAVSPNCFNNMVVNAPTVHSHYYYQICQLFSVHFGCLFYVPQIGTTDYTPPFTYSYECSSSLITYYAPSFVYMALILTFVNPLLEVFFQKIHKFRKPGTWLGKQLDYIVPLVLQDVSAEEDHTRPPYDLFNPYFDANLLLVNVVTYFGVLLTFGVVFPPLAIAILLSIYAAVYTSKIEVGRFLTNSIDHNLHKYMDIVESECYGVGSIPKLRQCVAMLIVFMCVFYTPFLFDTLGDSVGVDNAAWVVVFMPFFPVVVYGGHLAYIYATRYFDKNKQGQRPSASVELRKSEFFKSRRAVELLQTAMSAEQAETGRPTSPSLVSSNDSETGDAYTVNVLYSHTNAVA